MESNWKEAGGQSKVVRWHEVASTTEEGEKTIFVGNMVAGVYKRKREGLGANNSVMYEVESVEKGLLGVWDTTVLHDKMEEVPLGSEVEIEHVGTQKPKTGGGKPYHVFKVRFRPAPMTEVGEEEDELPEM